MSATLDTREWTFGAEHELGDWDRQQGPPPGMGVDRRDVTCMNNNGIAADPLAKSWLWGGEINTVPTRCIEGQVIQLRQIKEMHPGVTVNHRSNLHVHIRVPGLSEDLAALKRIALFGQRVLPRVLARIEPLPRPKPPLPMSGPLGGQPSDEHLGELRRWRRRRVSHQTILTRDREARRQGADTVAEFHRLTAPLDKSGQPLHHLQPREAVNLRQLMETDTVEFRHFPGTLDEDRLRRAIEWCACYMVAALGDEDNPILTLASEWGQIIPWPEYVHWKEVRYRATCHDGTLTRDEIERNISRILKGEFDDHPV